MRSHIQSNIRFLREAKNLTQAGLAASANCSAKLIGSYEEGRSEPRYGLIMKIASVLDVSVHELVTIDLELIRSATIRMASDVMSYPYAMYKNSRK